MLYLAWILSCQKHDNDSIETLRRGLKLVAFTSQGAGSPEQMMHQEHLRRCDTTCWEDLPVASNSHLQLSGLFKARWAKQILDGEFFSNRGADTTGTITFIVRAGYL